MKCFGFGRFKNHQCLVWNLCVVVIIVIGIVGCSWFDRDRQHSPTAPVGSALELGQYAQQAGLSRVVTVNGVTHQINGVIAGHPLGGLYLEINEQDGTGHAPGEHQVPVSLRDVKVAFSGLPSSVTAIQVLNKTFPESPEFEEIGQYAVTGGGVELSLSYGQWTQWFGPTHWAVVCKAIGSGTLKNAAVAIAGVLPDGTAVALGQGFAGGTSGSCPACPAGASCDLLNDAVAGNFTNNGDGTVTDSRTGLMWLRDAGCLGNGQWNMGAVSVQQRVANLNAGTPAPPCQDYTDGTYTDWRLPTVQEVVSLMQYSASGWGIPTGHPFMNVGLGYYWTADDAPSASAWYVRLAYGHVGNASVAGSFAAWAVR